MRLLRAHRACHATVVAYLALFIALGGTSFAAVQLSKNSVMSKHIKDGEVQSADVKDASLLAQDFSPGQLPAGAQGARGPQGEGGPQGERGLQGARGLPGDRGPAGLDGAPGKDGSAGVDGLAGQSFTWRGPWASKDSYSARDAVSFGGSSYIASENPRDSRPGDSTDSPWQLMASRGDQGPPGSDAQLNGTPAGGALAGTFPNPTIAGGSITTGAFAPTAKAPNADTLDGLNSTDLVNGHAHVYVNRVDAEGTGTLLAVPGIGSVRYNCNQTTNTVSFDVLNTSGAPGTMLVLEDAGAVDPAYKVAANGSAITPTDPKGGESVTYYPMANGTPATVISVAGGDVGSFCFMEAHAIVSP